MWSLRADPRLPTLALIAALAACTPDISEPLISAQNLDGGLDDAGFDATDEVTATDDLSGTWALLGDWSTCVTVIGTEELRTRYIHRVQIEQDGFRLHETHHICQALNTPLLGLETVISEAITEAASPLTAEGALIGSPGSRGYSRGAQAQLWGIRLDDPLVDPLPRRDQLPDDRIYDSDNDGNPGATLSIGGGACEVYVIQRAVSAVHAELQPDGSFMGSGFMTTEQIVIDATNAFCATPYVTRSNDAFSTVRLVRVDELGLDLDTDEDGEVTCAEIVAASGRLADWLAPDKTRCEADP